MEEDDWNVTPGHGLGPLELDLDRETILERLDAAEIKLDIDEADPTTIEFVDDEVSLVFADDAPHRLLQVEVYDDRVRVEGQAVIGRRPQELLDAWGISPSETRWRHDPEHHDPATGAVDEPAAPVSDQQLLINGTLWVLSKGLGLELYQGEVQDLLIRLRELVPERGSGPLTDAQRELLSQADLTQALEPPPAPGAGFVRALQGLLTLMMLVTMGVLFWQGMQFQQRWNNSVDVEGVVVAVKPPPPAILPDELTVEYQDQTGKTHQVVWKPSDVYVTREVGEKVAVRFLKESPDKPMGPARIRDAAFLVFVPYGIAVMAAYLVLLFVVGLAGKFFPAANPES